MILKPLHSSNILSVMDLIKNSLVADDTFVVVGGNFDISLKVDTFLIFFGCVDRPS